MGTYAHGQFNVDYEDRPDLGTLREKRVRRATAGLQSSDLSALLLWKDENVRYLTALRPQILAGKSTVLNGCLLLRNGEIVLFASGGEVQRVKMVMPWIREIHTVPIMEARGLVRGAVEHVIGPALRRHGLERARVGLDESGYCFVEALRDGVPDVELADGDSLMHAARLIKFPEEIALMEEAGAIAEAVTEAAMAAVRPGVRETDVVAEAMHALYRLGGEMSHTTTPFVASGEHMSPPNRIPSDKIIRDGDLVFIDIGAMWSGYFSDMARTIICGRPSRRQQEIYSAVHTALMEGVKLMAPGHTNDDVADTIRQVAADRGFGGNFISLFIGHGVGIGANEPPYIGEDLPGAETVVLQDGMTFAVEPLIWVPGVRGGGGVRLEDTVLVTADGPRPLSRTRFDERLLL